MHWTSTAAVSNLILRVSVGVTMALIGISEYRDFAPFVLSVTDGLGWMSFPGTVLAYILPALLIFGGGMLAIGRYSFITAWAGGIALGIIPVGLVLRTVMTGSPLPDMLTAAYPPVVWFIALFLAVNAFPDESGAETAAE